MSPGVQVEIAVSAALDPATIVPGQIALRDLGLASDPPSETGPLVAARLVLSASGRMLAVVPESRLAADHRFRLTASVGTAQR